MRADEVAGLGKLAGAALSGGTKRIAEFHTGIAERVFYQLQRRMGPAAAPARVVHDGIAGVNAAVHLLDRFGETRWLARQLAARSVGIKDLRYGNVVEADWVGRDPDASGNYCTDVPLHAGARHFVVVAALAGSPDSPMGDLVGDLLVRPKSASGDTSDHRRLPLPAEHIHRLSGLHHLDLLNHPQVYAQMHSWLVNRPEGNGTDSAFPTDRRAGSAAGH